MQRLRTPPRLTSPRFKEALWLIVPGAVWGLAFWSRRWAIQPYCATHPEECQGHHVFFLDQLTLGVQNKTADRWSFITQDSSFYWALGAITIWALLASPVGTSMRGRLRSLTTDLLILVQTILLNGAATEFLRVSVQRPRPFVYDAPSDLGLTHAHYTSFVSGHSSFSACVGVALFFTLLGRGAPRPLLICAGVISLILAISTAVFRVWAGRHFPTDVFAGAVVGTIAAFTIALTHRTITQPPSNSPPSPI